MARRVVTSIEVTDDLSGRVLDENDAETVLFSLDGKGYEIDVSRENAQMIRGRMKNFIEHARPARSDGKRPGAKGPGDSERASQRLRKEVRAWARDNGFPDQSDTGKIMVAVREAWNTTHPDRTI